MPSYSDPLRITYTRSIATTTTTWAIATPPGCTHFRVADIQASVTTTYNAVTTPAKVGVGVAGNVNDAGYISLGTTAAGSATGLGSQINRGTNPKYQAMDVSGTSNTITGTPKIPTVLGPALITFTANTGGSPAGAGVAEVTLEWF